ncbi:Pescadillo like [Actinidia chinensis var. chinensis]|uniref:Pescadillo like n=1 Tax=Actinidia chinensis var. chinensis TaxID=1590841 RepID=A0A2R6QTE2_ACTCC|nr:Pescadillo like [Actinidia chinensis var. chinensis]
MRKFTKKRDIVRPGITRFATSFLTLQSLVEKKEKLRSMVISDAWGECKHSKSAKGKAAYSTMLSMSFWNGVTLCLKVFAPLVQVLRLIDGDRKPSMGFLYGELKQAKEEIKVAYKNVEANYRPILDIIDAKAKDRLDRPLHLVAYLLNPYYFFKDQSIEDDPMVMDAFITCVEMFFPDDFQLQHLVSNVELLKYKGKVGIFGRALAMAGCACNDDNYDPVGWWSNYGNGVPNLKRMAKRILSLTTSSSGCERNWSTFEWIHTKKRNRLDATRLNNLVYVQFNAKLINKKIRKEKGVDVLLESQASMAQAWIVDGGDDEEVEPGSGLTWGMIGEASGADSAVERRRSCRNVEVRELHEEDFLSDQETEEDGDEEYDFESDEERVLEGYGEKELET